MFPHPGRVFLSYPRPPNTHLAHKSQKSSNLLFFVNTSFYIKLGVDALGAALLNEKAGSLAKGAGRMCYVRAGGQKIVAGWQKLKAPHA